MREEVIIMGGRKGMFCCQRIVAYRYYFCAAQRGARGRPGPGDAIANRSAARGSSFRSCVMDKSEFPGPGDQGENTHVCVCITEGVPYDFFYFQVQTKSQVRTSWERPSHAVVRRGPPAGEARKTEPRAARGTIGACGRSGCFDNCCMALSRCPNAGCFGPRRLDVGHREPVR